MFSTRRLTREQKAKEEMEWLEVNERIDEVLESVEQMLDNYCDYSIDKTGLILGPATYLTLKMFYNQNQIAYTYNIFTNQINYYIYFSVIIIPFSFVLDIFVWNCQELIHGWKVYDFVCYLEYRFSVREYRWQLRNPNVDKSLTEDFQSIDILCFSSQYYYIMGLVGFGLVQVVCAIDGMIRLKYNPLGDPTFLIIFILVFIMGELSQFVFIALGEVKIRQWNWYGLWAIKTIEGTIDDDIAMKLSIQNKKVQYDLEQEKIEQQALNSNRFRHQFLENNRSWLIHHLNELLTPPTLQSIGADGRPTIEYIRDKYNELLDIGKGKRHEGDRSDISSDDEEDDVNDVNVISLANQRRHWSRLPLEGSALVIAKQWLMRARKRRVFSKHVQEIIQRNIQTSCELCKRQPLIHDIRLTCYLCLNDIPNTHAIDHLIDKFEVQYSRTEDDPNLWKAFFRVNAIFLTRCSICDEKQVFSKSNELEESNELKPKVARAQDISSDEDDNEEEEDDIFDPLIVTRASSEGRMMSKWLLVARKKLGGSFPRLDARVEMERYALRLKKLKSKKNQLEVKETKLSLYDNLKDESFTNTTIALAQRWIEQARESIENKFQQKSNSLREELSHVLSCMKIEEDWFYTSSLRNEGSKLLTYAKDNEKQRRIQEAETSVKVFAITKDLEEFLVLMKRQIELERREFEKKQMQQMDKITFDIEKRISELGNSKLEKMGMFKALEQQAREQYGAAPSDLIQKHKSILLEMEKITLEEKSKMEKYRDDEMKESRLMFEELEKVKFNEIEKRQKLARENISRLRSDLLNILKTTEMTWQQEASKWLLIAKRKVEIKKREDQEAMNIKKKRGGIHA